MFSFINKVDREEMFSFINKVDREEMFSFINKVGRKCLASPTSASQLHQ